MITHYWVQRLGASLIAVAGVTVLVFLMLHLIPGDPVDLLLGEGASAQDKLSLQIKLGLNLPLYKQFWIYVCSLWSGWGHSISRDSPVLTLILERFPATLLLSICGLVTGLCLSIPIGILGAVKKNSGTDHVLSAFSLSFMSLPIFVLGPIATLIFAIRLRWLPVAGFGDPSHLILPSLLLGLGLSGILSRMIRASLCEVLKEDYMRTARAKGLSEYRIVLVHGFRNALLPVLTLLGNMLGGLLAGAVITETLFDWPGIGKLFLSAFQSRDYPLIQGIVLWISLSYFAINLVVDLAYSLVDPRIRLGGPR
jgi:peptide/nickel transport system permease protein